MAKLQNCPKTRRWLSIPKRISRIPLSTCFVRVYCDAIAIREERLQDFKGLVDSTFQCEASLDKLFSSSARKTQVVANGRFPQLIPNLVAHALAIVGESFGPISQTQHLVRRLRLIRFFHLAPSFGGVGCSHFLNSPPHRAMAVDYGKLPCAVVGLALGLHWGRLQPWMVAEDCVGGKKTRSDGWSTNVQTRLVCIQFITGTWRAPAQPGSDGQPTLSEVVQLAEPALPSLLPLRAT